MPKNWREPGIEYRAVPFWSLNGKLDGEELKRQIDVFGKMGMGGVFFHSRTGLETEYMSEEWLDFAENCAVEASEKGMRVWLYDEDRWPSGTCGGLVTENPEFRMKFLSMYCMEAKDFSADNYGKELVATFAVRLQRMPDGKSPVDMYDFREFHAPSEIPDGWYVCVFVVEEMAKNSFYNGNTYVDTMNAEATDEFIKSTHEKYYKRLGARFGKDISGLFTDEPHRGELLNGFGITNKNALAMLPYTPKLFDAFCKRWNKDLKEELPLLWFRYKGEDFSQTMWQYVETVQQLFLENYAKPYSEWCRSHGIAMTGHVLHEDSLACQTTMSGSVMRFYEYMDIPGMDNLGNNTTLYFVPKMVQSVAKQCGKKWVLSELFGGTGWKSTFQDYKQIADWQMCFGVNLLCYHLSWYTMKGEAKRDYPASISKQSAWYPQFKYVNNYFARLGYLLTESECVTENLVVMPVESAWGLTHFGTYTGFFGVTDPLYKKLEEDFSLTAQTLANAHIDFDYGDEEMMSRLASVETDGNDVFIKMGSRRYRSLILSGMLTVRASTLALANKFAAAGGTVILCEPPRYLEGLKASIKFDSACRCCSIGELPAVVPSSRFLQYSVEGENCAGNFISTLRADGKDYLLFIVCSDRESGHMAKIVVQGEWNAEKFNLRSGDNEPVFYRAGGGKTVIVYEFARAEELMLHITKEAVAAGKYGRAETVLTDIPCTAEYSLDEDNVLVLDRARCYADGNYIGEYEILKADRAIRTRYGLDLRGGEMVQPWFRKKFGNAEFSKKICEIKLEFRFNVAVMPQKIALMTEDPDSFIYELNGKPIIITAREESHIDCCFTVLHLDADCLTPGENVLSMQGVFGEETNLEALYLLGDFGVKAEKISTITSLPARLAYGDITEQGLPFYTGNLTYHIPVEKGRYDVSFGKFSAACLSATGKIAAFAPFEINDINAENGIISVTAHLTRKNLFGPLHELPADLPICGPGDYVTKGENFSEDYILIQQGLFERPIVKQRISF